MLNSSARSVALESSAQMHHRLHVQLVLLGASKVSLVELFVARVQLAEPHRPDRALVSVAQTFKLHQKMKPAHVLHVALTPCRILEIRFVSANL